MHSIEALEKQWKRYQIKKYFSFGMVSAALLGMVIAFSLLFDSESYSNSKELSKQKIQTAMIDRSKEQELQIPRVAKQNKNIEKETSSVETVVNNNIRADKPQNTTPILADNQPRKKVEVDLEQTPNMGLITDVILRFYESKDPNDSLFLATSYYEQNDYAKAFYWAIETNRITEDMEDSWIIMAKSKARMGDRNEALRILKAYVAKKDSKEASNLLERMEAKQW